MATQVIRVRRGSAIEEVTEMSDADLLLAWDCLDEQFDPNEIWNTGITMDDWSNLVYSELTNRNLI